MRQFQITIFILATASLIASAFEIGPNSGDYLLYAGIATLLVDVVCIQLWPSPKRPWNCPNWPTNLSIVITAQPS